MKLAIDPTILKSDGPARAEISVTVKDLADGETFDRETMSVVAKNLYNQEKWHLCHMYMFGHQTFETIFKFVYSDKEIRITLFPCYTDNL